MFKLHRVGAPRFWMPPPAAIEIAVNLFKKDWIARHLNPHVFIVPRLVIHLWRKNLGKDADVLWTVGTGDHFWNKLQHEPLMLAIIFILHMEKHTGGPELPCIGEPESLKKELKSGFKFAGGRDPSKLSDLDRTLRSLWNDPEGRSQSLLLQFLDWAGNLPPV